GAAVVALVAAAVLRVGSRVIHSAAAAALALLSFAAILAGVPFPVILVVAGLAGWQAGKRNPALLRRDAEHGDAEPDGEPDVPVSIRTRLWKALVIWLIPVALLVAAGGVLGELAG